MILSTIPPFSQRKPLYPFMFLFWGEAPQIGLQTFVDNFCLTIFWGWYDVLFWRCVPFSLKSYYQKLLVKVGSRLDTMEVSMPWSLNILSMKTWSTNFWVNGCRRVQKWAYLESLSTTTMMTDFFPDFGRLVMKSMETFVHMEARSGNGCKVLDSLIISRLFHCHTSHSATKLRMSFFMLVQKKEWHARA